MADQPKVIARGKLGPHDIEAEVLNPGDWFGKVWLVGNTCGVSTIWFGVEADSVSDALDEFAENDKTRHLVEIQDSEKADYGFEVNPGDQIRGVRIEKKGWIDLNGMLYDERPPCVSEPSTSGQGIDYDDDHLVIHGQEGIRNGQGSPWPCRYFSAALPQQYRSQGMSPTEYADREWEDEVDPWPEGFRPVLWSEVKYHDEVWLRGTSDGRPHAYGPFRVETSINMDPTSSSYRNLRNGRGQVFMQHGEQLLVKESK